MTDSTLRRAEALGKLCSARTEIVMDYTNWKGVRHLRRVRCLCVDQYVSAYHGETRRWFLAAIDLDDDEMTAKDFAIDSIHDYTS